MSFFVLSTVLISSNRNYERERKQMRQGEQADKEREWNVLVQSHVMRNIFFTKLKILTVIDGKFRTLINNDVKLQKSLHF